MSFSNLNLLPQALSLIPPTPFQYRKFSNNEIDEYGQVTIGYGEWKEAYGIVVPAGRAMQNVEGIDLTQNRVSVFIKGVELDATYEQRSPDQIRYLGRIYNVIQVNDWFSYDDFHNVTAQEVKNIDEAEPYSPYRNKPKEPDPEPEPTPEPAPAPNGRRARVNEYGEVVYE